MQLPRIPTAMRPLILFHRDVEKELSRLDVNKGPGQDDIPPMILRILAAPLTYIVNLSLSTGEFPSDWKSSVICPIFKKGDKEDASNYRPISLTCAICKVMEKFVKSAVMAHLKEVDALSANQHGFLPRRSCLTNLLESKECITRLMDAKEPVDVVFIDFAKAFDSVYHTLLLHKLTAYNLHRDVIAWIKSFLEGRSIQVQVKGVRTDPVEISSGFPQGLVIGPILFLLYVNDLPQQLQAKTLLFADDVKIISPRSEWAELVQSVRQTYSWEDIWDLPINTDKCGHLTIGTPPNAVLAFKSDGSLPIQNIDEAKDLRLMIDKSFTPTRNCLDAVNKAR